MDSVTYLVESAPQSRRGIAGSVANLGSTAGMLLAAAVAAIITTWAGSERVLEWGWRIPFLLGGIIASIAFYSRRHLPEINTYTERTETTRVSPLGRAIREQPRILWATLLFTSGYGIVDYVTMVFLPTYAHEFGRVAEQQALRINAMGQVLALSVVPFSGWISDRLLTRRTLLVWAFVAEAAISWQAFKLVSRNGVEGLWLAQLTFAFLLAIVMGAAPAMLAEQFHPEYRVSAHAVTFNIGIGVAGGTAPMIATALIKVLSNPLAPAGYLLLAAALSTVSAFMLHDRSREPLAKLESSAMNGA